MLYFPKDFLNNIVSPDSYDEDKIIDVFLRHSNCTAKNRLQTVQTTSERLTFFLYSSVGTYHLEQVY